MDEPAFDIVDLMAGKGRGKKAKQKPAEHQNELDRVPDVRPVEEPIAGPSNETDDVNRKRGRTAQSGDETETQVPEAKFWKLRPKRTHDELMKQVNESRRRLDMETGTETDQPEPKKQTMTQGPEGTKKTNIFRNSKDFLFSSDDEVMNTVRNLQVEITEDSTEPMKGTIGSACYDLTAHSTVVVPAHGMAMVPLNLRMAIPPGFFLLLLSRSGLAKKGVVTLSGVIDVDYRGLSFVGKISSFTPT